MATRRPPTAKKVPSRKGIWAGSRISKAWDPELRWAAQALVLVGLGIGLGLLGMSLFYVWQLGHAQPQIPEPIPQPPTATVFVPSPTPSPSPTTSPTPTAIPPTPEPTATIPSEEALRAMVGQMSLEDKIAQMVLVGFQGQSLAASPSLSRLISTYHIGGIFLLEENAHDPQQIAQLVGEAQALAMESGAHIPLFVANNHEGGVIVRITEGVTEFPGNMAIAATGNPEYASLAAALAARELRAMGINMNLAPVLDVNDQALNPIIGVRSFGASPEQVAQLGQMTIRGFQENGVIAVAKHFPGHGSTTVDSHIGLPRLDKPLAQLEQTELPPFRMAVAEGVAAIMTAHILVPAWEPSSRLPASLSTAIVSGVLREQLGFDGLIVSDALEMEAVSSSWGQASAAVRAVQAGTDVVLSGGSPATQEAILWALLRAAQEGRIAAAQIDAAVVRILRLKYEYGLFEHSLPGELSIVGNEVHQAAADEIALAAITLLRDETGMVPLPPDVRRLLVLSPNELPPGPEGQGTLLGEALRARAFEVTELVFDPVQSRSREATYAEALRAAPEHDLVLFGEWELVKRFVNQSDRWQERLVAALQESGTPVLVISWHNPAAITRLPNVPTFVAAYGPTAAQVRAITAVLTGQAAAQGRLPMTIQ